MRKSASGLAQERFRTCSFRSLRWNHGVSCCAVLRLVPHGRKSFSPHFFTNHVPACPSTYFLTTDIPCERLSIFNIQDICVASMYSVCIIGLRVSNSYLRTRTQAGKIHNHITAYGDHSIWYHIDASAVSHVNDQGPPIKLMRGPWNPDTSYSLVKLVAKSQTACLAFHED